MRPHHALVFVAILAGCCTTKQYEDMRHRAENAEADNAKLLMYLAGKDEDNAMLQKWAMEKELEALAWQRGAAEQAYYFAHLAEGCDL